MKCCEDTSNQDHHNHDVHFSRPTATQIVSVERQSRQGTSSSMTLLCYSGRRYANANVVCWQEYVEDGAPLMIKIRLGLRASYHHRASYTTIVNKCYGAATVAAERETYIECTFLANMALPIGPKRPYYMHNNIKWYLPTYTNINLHTNYPTTQHTKRLPAIEIILFTLYVQH